MADATEINLRAVRRGAIAIAGGIVFAGLASWFLLRALGPAVNAPAFISATPAAPRLQAAPQPERASYFAEKARKIGSYGWVDRQAGVARIPLDEAMRLLAARATGPQPVPAAPGSRR